MILPFGFHSLLNKDTPYKKSSASSPPLRDGYEKGKINTGTHRLYKPYIFLQSSIPPPFIYNTNKQIKKLHYFLPFSLLLIKRTFIHFNNYLQL